MTCWKKGLGSQKTHLNPTSLIEIRCEAAAALQYDNVTETQTDAFPDSFENELIRTNTHTHKRTGDNVYH